MTNTYKVETVTPVSSEILCKICKEPLDFRIETPPITLIPWPRFECKNGHISNYYSTIAEAMFQIEPMPATKIIRYMQ